MTKPVDPQSEARRQDALDAYAVVGTAPEAAYDDLCELARELCQAPAATITLIDHERAWFKARRGVAAAEVRREDSFCAHALDQTDVLVIEDTRLDPRFAANPLVTGETNFRFYAGAPLIAPGGEVLGTLCVFDHRPRTLTPAQTKSLLTLARNVVAQFELRKHLGRAVEGERRVTHALTQNVLAEAEGAEIFTRMCHELRTPVVGILGMLRALLDPSLTDLQREQIAMARQAGDGLLSLVNNVLDLAALKNRRMTAQSVNLELLDLVRTTLNPLTVLAREKNLALDLTSDSATEMWVSSDPVRLSQILNNLVGNAIKFTTQGAINVHLTVEGSRLRLVVRDTGPGVPADAIESIFVPYTQGDASIQARYGGTGLGLPITREIATLLGGTVTCVPNLVDGSAFEVLLPMTLGFKPSSSPVHGLRVLVVDDVTINQKVFRAILKPFGAEVHLASDGARALELFNEHRYDLVLMDRYMPGLDGLETTREMRRIELARGGDYTPIFGASAAFEAADRQAFIASGADDTVAKPLRTEEFWSKINRIRAIQAKRAA